MSVPTLRLCAIELSDPATPAAGFSGRVLPLKLRRSWRSQKCLHVLQRAVTAWNTPRDRWEHLLPVAVPTLRLQCQLVFRPYCGSANEFSDPMTAVPMTYLALRHLLPVTVRGVRSLSN